MTLTLAISVPRSPTVASVHSAPVYAVNITKGVPYGKALLCDGGNFSQANCTAIELLLDVMLPLLTYDAAHPGPFSAEFLMKTLKKKDHAQGSG